MQSYNASTNENEDFRRTKLMQRNSKTADGLPRYLEGIGSSPQVFQK